MKHIARLIAVSAEPDVFQRTLPQPRVDPETHNALIRAAELSRAGQHAAAIDPNRKPKRRRVFEREDFRGDLARAVKRDRRRGGKFLAHTLSRYAVRQWLSCIEGERAVLFNH